jgi:NitT/TauT family transport system substrate-binding protein
MAHFVGSERWSRRSLIHRLCGVAGVFAAALMAGCQPPPQPPLVVGLAPWVGYDPLIVAREDRQVDTSRVKMVELTTNAEAVRHFRNGLLDAAALTLDQVLQLSSQGIDLRIVAVLSESSGADVVMASPLVISPDQLQGKPVLLEPSTVSALILRSLLQAGGLQESDITVVPMESSQHLAALQAGRAVAAISYEPLATQLRQAGFSTLFDSRQMPGQILDVLVVRPEVLTHRGGDVDELLRAWAIGLDRLQNDRQSIATRLAPSLQMTADEYLETLNGLRFMTLADSLAYLAGVQAPLRQRGLVLAKALVELGQMEREVPDLARLIDSGPAGRTVQGRGQP